MLLQAPENAEPETICGETPSWACRWVLERTENETLAQAAEFLFARPFAILVIVVVAWVANRIARGLIRRTTDRIVERSAEVTAPRPNRGRFKAPAVLAPTIEHNIRAAARAQTLGSVLRSVSTFVIWTIAILLVLGQFDINLGPLIAGAGVAGVALGFGAQSLVKDFLSGIFMILEDQYGVGDIIDVGEAVGEVEAVSLRTTRIRALDGGVWHVPNGEIHRVANLSQDWSRALLDIEVAYGTDLDEAKRVILEVSQEMSREPAWETAVLDTPEIWGVEAVAADRMAIRLVIKTKPGRQWGLQRELRGRLKEAFDAAGFEYPLPQSAVHFKSDLGSLLDQEGTEEEPADDRRS